MIYAKLALVVALSVGALADPQRNNGNNRNGNGNNNNNEGGNEGATPTAAGKGVAALTLDADAVQTGSFVDGSGNGAEAGQALSATSQNNFINFCSGKTLTNGLQNVDGSCNGIVMGDIPAKAKMVSSMITFPQTGSEVEPDEDFTITVQMANIQAGSFTNPDITYYAGPQFLEDGLVVGHTHITVQDLGKSLNPTKALDATQFAFFKGINDAGNGKGLLSAKVTDGLPAGNYRVCTMASASNHQPVLMPVAQRGTPDDCTKFVVAGKGKAAADATASNAAQGGNNDAKAAQATPEATADATAGKGADGGKNGKQADAAPATASGAADAEKGSNRGGRGGGRNARQRFTKRQFIA